MPFLLKDQQSFYIVDTNNKYGVFFQHFSNTGLSRPILICPYSCQAYSAALDSHNQLHVVCQITPSQIDYFTYKRGRFYKKELVQDNQQNCHFSYPTLVTYQDTLQMIYVSYRTVENTYSLIRLDMDGSFLDSLLETSSAILGIKTIVNNDVLYIFYYLEDSPNVLRCITYSPSNLQSTTILEIDEPIYDYSICMTNNTISLVYTLQVHGQYQLFYTSPNTHSNHLIHTTSNILDPCLFSYFGYLWIHYMEEGHVFVMLSVDNGTTFSSPVSASIQNRVQKYHFSTNTSSSFYAQECYASCDNTLRLNTVYTLDFDQIHPHSKIPLEFQLLIEGLSLHTMNDTSSCKLQQEFNTLQEQFITLKQQYDVLQANTSEPVLVSEDTVTDMDAAKAAFMNEMPNFDATPHI